MSLTERRERLLSLLPALYRHQPDNSAVGTLVEVMAGQLAAFDQAAEQVLRNRSLAIAEASTTEEAALEQLGELLQVHRLPGESIIMYQERIQLTGSIVYQEAVTPRAMLYLALVDLGLRPCPYMPYTDSITQAWGIPWEKRRFCADCSGPSEACPQAERHGPPTAWVIDNPLCRAVYHEQVRAQQQFSIHNDSLFPDRPLLELRLVGQAAVSGLTIQSRRTGKVVRYSGRLRPGETLRIAPNLSRVEQAPFTLEEFAGPDRQEGLHRKADAPGQAHLRRDSWGEVQDVSSLCAFLRATACYSAAEDAELADNRFAQSGSVEGLRFEQAENRVQTPALLPGENSWSVTACSAEDAGPLDDTLLIDLRCTWLTRKPFSFSLSVPLTEQVREAEQRGALEVIRQDVERVRVAGIRAEVFFSAPVFEKESALSGGRTPKTMRTTDQHALTKRALTDLSGRERKS